MYFGPRVVDCQSFEEWRTAFRLAVSRAHKTRLELESAHAIEAPVCKCVLRIEFGRRLKMSNGELHVLRRE